MERLDPNIEDQTDGSEPFRIRVAGPSLIVTFRERCQTASWAPLHGGFRTDVSHVLSYQVQKTLELDSPQTTLRRAAGKAGIRGTFVGMIASSTTHQCSLARADSSDLCVGAISVLDGEALRSDDVEQFAGRPGGNRIGLIVTINRSLTHEAMFEAISLATEAKVRAFSEFDIDDRSAIKEGAPRVTSLCVVIAASGTRRHDTCESDSVLGRLMRRVLLEGFRKSIAKGAARK